MGKQDKPTGALWEFARRVEPGDGIEFVSCDDRSATITAVRNGTRVLSLVVDPGWADGLVYDLSKVDEYLAGRPGYHIYPDKAQETFTSRLAAKQKRLKR